MSDIIDRRPGGGGASGSNVRYHDEGDGSYSEAQAGHLRAWNTNTLTWDRVPVDTSTGRLMVDIPAGGTAGTQYTEGDVDATITGNAVMWEDTGNALVAISAAKPLPVNIVAGSSSGVQYTEADVDASITGTAVMWEDAGNALVAVSAAKPLPIGGDAASGAADAGNPVKIGGRYNTTKPTLTDGQRGDAQLDSRGKQLVALMENNGPNPVVVGAPADASNSISLATVANAMVYNGSAWDRMRGDTTNGLDVDVTRLPGVAGDVAAASADSGNPVKVGGKYNTTRPTLTDGQRGNLELGSRGSLRVQIGVADSNVNLDALNSAIVGNEWGLITRNIPGGTQIVGGSVAHDAADTGNPQKIGAKAETSPKGVTLVADGDRTDLYADADGILMVKQNTSYGDIINERIADTGGTSSAFANFSAVASTRNYVTSIIIYNSSATAGFVDIRDGTAGAVLATIPAPAGGGTAISFPTPLRQPTANTALAYDVSGAITTVYITMVGFQSKG